MEQKIRELLSGIVHPERGVDLLSGGMVERIAAEEEGIEVVLRFAKAHDPFAAKLKRQTEEALAAAFPGVRATVTLHVGTPRRLDPERKSTAGQIAHVVAIASGKGGVGKSTVTANLAVALRNMGYRVGLLDADIYGPSQPRMFGTEGYLPEAMHEEGIDQIVPAEAMGIELMSIGYFVKPDDALLWRGAMAVNALRQLIHQTRWGRLDFLLADLPPGTGDIHLSIVGELKIDAAVIVSTPQQVAVADVRRGVELFRNPQVNIPVAGIIENMAWFTPEELPENRYYLFGRGGARAFAEENGLELLGEIPIIQSIMDGSDTGRPAAAFDPRVEEYYRAAAARIVEKVTKSER